MKQVIKQFLCAVADAILSWRGFRFPDYFNSSHRLWLAFFGIERDVARLFRRRLGQGMCVLDVGANIGWISRICAHRVGKSGRVVAFEPDPYTRGFLEFNVSRFPNVTVSPIALSDGNGPARLHLHPQSGTSNSLVEFDPAAATVEVECRTVDRFLAEHPELRPDFIKIDVEGAEPKVLAGMRETVRRLPGLALVIEFCPENLANGGCTPEGFCGLLDELGLGMEWIGRDGRTEPLAGLEELRRRLGSGVYGNLLCRRK
jgi:FkbM family methyltransferase